MADDLLPLSPPFSPEEWLTDFQWVTKCVEDDDRFHHSTILGYFERCYGEQAEPRSRRVIAALRYIEEHRQDFDEGALGINSAQGFAPGAVLLKALLVIYNGAGEDQLEYEWSVEMVKGIARVLETQR